MIDASVSIARTSLSLSALVISDDGTGTYSLTNQGLGRPVVTPRYTYFPESEDEDGSVLRSATKEQTALQLEVLVQAATSAALETALDALDDALWQFAYDVTVTVDGVAKVWHCLPAIPATASGVTEYAHAAQFFEVLTVTIPCHPVPA